MPNQYDLTGENIENTYQRVLQTPDGINIYDGTGSLFTVTATATAGGSNTQIQFNSASALSGSSNFSFDYATNSVTLTGSLINNGLIYPSTDNGEFSFIQTDGNGNLSLQYVNTLYEVIYNGESTQLAKGTPVYISGSQGANSIAYRADAGNPSKMPVVYVAADNIDPSDTGRAIALGLITGVNTTGYPGGTEIYVAVGGGWTSSRPTGSAIIQVLGYVTKEGNGGQGVVLNPGPANLPNLPSGSVWVGNNNSIPITILTSSLRVDSSSFAFTASYYNEIDPIFTAKSASLATTGSNIFVGDQVVTGSFTIDTASSAAALRVTQTGTGDAIVVEDSTNPDTTPFVVASDGRVGIGVQAPLSTYKLHVRNGAVTNSSTWGGSVGVFENSGSNAYLSVLSSDTYTSGIGFGSAAHRVSANLNWNSTTKDFNLATNTASAFLTFGTDSGTERMRITSGGFVGINTTSPQYLLDVSGSSRITGDLIVTGTIDGGTF